MIVDVARARGFHEDAIDHLKHASKLYDRCRSNRNAYVHAGGAMAATSDGSKGLALVRKKGPELFGQKLPDSLADIRRVGEQIRELNRYLADLCMTVATISKEENVEPWPEKPPLPELVVRPPPQEKPKPPPPPRSSQA
jgi:hypothetical protein